MLSRRVLLLPGRVGLPKSPGSNRHEDGQRGGGNPHEKPERSRL